MKHLFFYIFLFYFVASTTLGAEKSTLDQDVYEQVQQHIVNRQRAKAIELIKSKLEKNSENSNPEIKWDQLLSRVTHLFFTEEANQQFQVGVTEYFKNLSLSISSLERALKLEPQNFSIMHQLALAYMRSKDCVKSDKLISDIEKYGVEHEPIVLLKLQLFACSKDYQNLDQFISESKLTDKNRAKFAVHYSLVRIKSAFYSKNYEIAGQLVKNNQAVDQDFPEYYLWDWRIKRAMGETDENLLNDYKRRCQKLTSSQKQKYIWTYDLCLLSDVK